MKTKIKRHSRAAISVVLAVCMLLSCMTVGLIATDAAQAAAKRAAAETSAAGTGQAEDTDTAAEAAEAEDAAVSEDSGEASDSAKAASLSAKEKDDAPLGAIDNSAKIGDWNTSGRNALYIKMPGSNSFTQYNVNAAGYIDFTLTTSGYCEWYFYAEYSNDGRCYKLKGGDAEPQGGMGDTTHYYAKRTTGDSGGTGNENYYVNLPAGQYVVKYENVEYGQLKYQFWRKLNAVYGDFGDGNGWHDDVANYKQMTYSTENSGCYFYDIEGAGQTVYFKYIVESTNYYSYTKDYDLWEGNKRSYTDAYEAKTDTNLSFSFTADSSYNYKIWTKGNKVWVTREAKPAFDYYVTSAGATDEDTGFTENIWVANDLDGGMSTTSLSGYTHEKFFDDVPIGTYRFKITDGTWANSWGDNGSIDYADTSTYIQNTTKENNGNAKFEVKAAADITIYFNKDTGAIKVAAAEGTAPTEYYVVGMASDGTRGMFANVWAENWTSYNDDDKMRGSGPWTKTYTDFRGTTGTYTYKVAKVTASGVEYIPADGDGQTVNVTSKTTSVTFTLTEDTSGEEPTYLLTADTIENSGTSADWPPADIGTTTSSSNFFEYSNNDQFNEQNNSYNGNWRRTIAAEKVSDGVYWIDLTDLYHGAGNIYFGFTSGGTPSDFTTNTTTVKSSDDRFSKNASGDAFNYKETGSNTTLYTAQPKKSNYFQEIGNLGDTQRWFAQVSRPHNTVEHIGAKYETSSHTYTIYYSTGSVAPPAVATVDIYAKNGTLRDDTFNRFTNLANTDIVSITDPDGIVHTSANWATASATWASSAGTWDNNEGGYGSTFAHVTKVPVGSKIKLRTYLSGNATQAQIFQTGKAFKDTHYLKAYSINGMTYKLHTASEAQTDSTTNYFTSNANQYYEEEWTVEKVNTTYMKNTDTIEITPIYYMKDNSNCKTFYIDGYIGDLQTKWGTMLSVYPYYEGKSNKANAFGGYPGQPMLFWGGKYQMEVPLTVDGTVSGAQVKGLTMHNGYWDLLHRSLDTKTALGHCQTYDYDDFYKLYKEKNADTIYFWFKYRTTHDNYGDDYDYYDYEFAGTAGSEDAKAATTYAGSGYNGVELVKDYYGRQVDVFGNLLKTAEQSDYETSPTQDKELLIVSTGYKDTYVGEYGTIWAVYAPQSSIPDGSNDTAGKFIGYISSSMLYLNSLNSVNNYTNGTSTDNGRMSWSKFKNTYNHLKTYYKGVPALISYEKEIYNKSKDQASRSDGRWFYSMGTDKITANIKIQYTSDSTATLMDESVGWIDDAFNDDVVGYGGEKNVGTTTGCSAFFTNTSPTYLVGKTTAADILVNNEQHFTFQAASGGTYEFVGWVRECGGEKNAISSTNGLGQSNISANDTYIARFRQVASGKLVISHNVVQDSTHKGNGTKYLKVQIYDGSDNLKKEYIREDGTDVDVSEYIKSTNTGYKIKVTLSTVPDEDCIVDARTCSPGDNKFTTAAFSPAAGQTLTQTKEFLVSDVFNGTSSTVTAVRYYTYLTKTPMTYNYSITYHYRSRFWGDQTYTVNGTVEDERYSSQYFEGTKSGAKLTDEFIKNSTPYEKNFRQKINWNYTASAVGDAAAMTKGNTSPSANTYNLTAEVYSANTVDDEVKAEFLLPYKYNADTSKGANDRDKSAVALPVYTAADGTAIEGAEAYAFDEDTYESFTLTSQVGKLFQWDNSVNENYAQASDHASQYKLVEAAPYILYSTYDEPTDLDPDGKLNPVTFHHKQESEKRYFTGNYFTVNKSNGSGGYNQVTYYLNEKPEGDTDPNHIAITAELVNADESPYVITVYKPEKMGTYVTVDGNQVLYDNVGTTYKYAVRDDKTGDVYFFAYVMNSDDQMVDNNGNTTTTPVFNGQYIRYHVNDVIDGIVKNGNGDNYGYQKKYFTRWDIFNSAGQKVASSYYRAFNYSGYENYTIKPIYISDTPTAATYDPDVSGENGLSASISYLGDSRNQWKEPGTSISNPDARGTYETVTEDTTKATFAGDKLFADFAIAYNYNDRQLSTISTDEATIKIGMVIEKLGQVQTVNGKVVTDPIYYQGLSTYNAYNVTEMETYIKAKINGTTAARPNSGVSGGATYVAFGDNTTATPFAGDATSTLLFGEGTPMLDNKNRLQYFYTFTKSANGTLNTTTRPVDNVYRVSSYIYVKTKSDNQVTVKVSSPVYFTLYDTANR